MFVVSVIILILFVVVIFSLRMYAQQVFSALFTGVVNTIACVCTKGVNGVFPAGLWLVFVSSVRDSFERRHCLPIFPGMCCVCVYAHAHTLHVVYSDVCPGVGTRHLESPEEIQMYCSDSIHTCGVRSTHVYVFAGLQVEVWTNCLLFSFNICFLSQKRKEEDVSKTPISQIQNRFERIDPQSRVLTHFS